MTIPQQLERLRFIQDARRVYGGGYEFTTKPDLLNIELTHYFTGYSIGKKLRKPILVKLPSYTFWLQKDKIRIRFAQEMKVRLGYLYALNYPQQLGPAKSWDYWSEPCLGSYKEIYRSADTWTKRAMIATEYLQIAKPDMGGINRTLRFAYGYGLVGDEIIKL